MAARDIYLPVDTNTATTAPVETIELGYTPDGDSPDLEWIKILGNTLMWRNEWGAIRGTSPFNWGDALVRALVNPGSTINAGNAFELVDRNASGSPVLWGRQWRTGNLIRNNNVMSDVVVVNASTSDAAINALGLPDGTVVIERIGV